MFVKTKNIINKFVMSTEKTPNDCRSYYHNIDIFINNSKSVSIKLVDKYMDVNIILYYEGQSFPWENSRGVR